MPYNTTSFRTIKNGTRWTIREGYESILDKINLDDFRSMANGKPYKIIKDTKVRSVILIPGSDVADTGIYIKLFKRKDYGDYVKYLFTPTRTWTEWKVADELLSKGINTALPLAIAEKRTWSLLDSSMIVTKAVPRSEPLMEFCQTTFKGILSGEKLIEKRKLLNDLAGFIRNIHGKGFFHNDLHAGNILIKFNNDYFSPDKDYSFYLMDLHHVKILKKLSQRKRLHNLAQLFNSLSSMLTKSDRLGFVKSYGINALGNIENEQELTNQIESESSRIRKIHYRSRLKRCLKESSNFSRKKLNDMRMFSRKGYDTNSFPALIGKHNNALANNDENVILKNDSKTTLTRFPLKNGEIRSVVVKQYKIACGLCLLKNIFRNSAGRKSWIAGNGLSVYGFNSAKPLALIEKKTLGIVEDSYLIMEDVNDSLEMDRFIIKHFNNQLESAQFNDQNHPISPPSQGGEKGEVIRTNKVSPAIEQSHQLSSEDPYAFNVQIVMKKKKAFINNFAKTIARMHNHNIFHSDLKTCNIMVKEVNGKYQERNHLISPHSQEEKRGEEKNSNRFPIDVEQSQNEEDNKSFDFIFLDYDKVAFNEKISIQKRIKTLTQINLSTPRCITTTDRFRFLREYLSACLPERSSQSGNAQAGLKRCDLIDEKKTILREIINLSKTEKILYVSFNGDVTEDW
jgi:tRNA A-37 threonylcarbamoyl transferase component Bud32